MMNQKSEDCLPPGWTVKVKVRKSGKKDKYYFEPSSQMKFNSRENVFRYLKTAAIRHSESEESRTVKQPGNNVEVQKAIAQGLPLGWTREIRVTGTANKIRRDSFYIDPVNGNALRSLREVHRYLTTGKLSRACKSRNRKSGGIEFQHDDISSPAVSKKEMLAIGKAKRQIKWSENSPELSGITNDEVIVPNATSVGESSPFTEPNSGAIVTKPEAKNPEEQSDGQNDFSEFVSSPDKSDGKNDFSENGPIKNESIKRQRKTEDVNLHRRASKRLAGLQAKPVLLEVKTGRRARPVACEESYKHVASTTKCATQCPENSDVKHETKSITDDPPEIDTSPDSTRKEHFCVDLSILPKNVMKTKSENAYEQLLKCKSFLPQEDVLEKRVGTVESEDKADVKQVPLLKMPVENFLTDPCIAFAVKTLTRGVFDASISSEASPMPNNIDHPSTALGPENKHNEKLPSPELPVTRGGNVDNDNVVEKLVSNLELPVGEILADPCIEFAIKTLTGEIPLDNNLGFEDYFHQLSTSKKNSRMN